MNNSNISWAKAFKNVADYQNNHDLTMKITNELFPLEDGKLWTDWVCLGEDERTQVYTELANYKQLNKIQW